MASEIRTTFILLLQQSGLHTPPSVTPPISLSHPATLVLFIIIFLFADALLLIGCQLLWLAHFRQSSQRQRNLSCLHPTCQSLQTSMRNKATHTQESVCACTPCTYTRCLHQTQFDIKWGSLVLVLFKETFGGLRLAHSCAKFSTGNTIVLYSELQENNCSRVVNRSKELWIQKWKLYCLLNPISFHSSVVFFCEITKGDLRQNV